MTQETLEVRAFILTRLSQPLAAIGMDKQSIGDNFDLRATGVIDSLGFIQLVGDLEVRFARSLDLSGVPPEQLTNLGVLSSHIARQISSAA